MSNLLTRYDFTPFNRATIGFDRIFDDLDRVLSNPNTNTYPPYNIEKLSENEFVISVAVAGFTMDDLEITHDNNELTVTGTSPAPKEDVTFLHKGIATRSFTRVFTVADHVEVTNAELENGLLNVYLKREIPEELQPKKIAITYKS